MKRMLLLMTLIAPAAFAHDTFLIADGRCGATTVHLTSGMTFPALDSAIAPDRVTHARIQVPGRRIDLEGKPAVHSLDFAINAPDEGLGIVSVELAPKTLDLNATQVGQYLDDIAASDDVRAEWKAHPGRWRETYTKHAKAFVQCGVDPHVRRDAFLSADLGFEIFPQMNDFGALHPGGVLDVIAVHGRELKRGFPIVMQRDDGTRVVAKTDDGGHAKFTIPAPGRYMLSATDLRRSDSKDVDWVSDFTTLTFEIK